LLDEPFAALDAAAVRFTEALIASHVAQGGAVVYTTHQEATIGAAAPRVVELG
jgi:heme exporter protein A